MEGGAGATKEEYWWVGGWVRGWVPYRGTRLLSRVCLRVGETLISGDRNICCCAGVYYDGIDIVH